MTRCIGVVDLRVSIFIFLEVPEYFEAWKIHGNEYWERKESFTRGTLGRYLHEGDTFLDTWVSISLFRIANLQSHKPVRKAVENLERLLSKGEQGRAIRKHD